MPRAVIHGDGQAPNLLGDLRDMGRWTARIIDDERTLNKFVFTCSDVLTENQIFALTEEAVGEKIESEKVCNCPRIPDLAPVPVVRKIQTS